MAEEENVVLCLLYILYLYYSLKSCFSENIKDGTKYLDTHLEGWVL